jgi:uncharacterized DUF497 family protein
MQITVLAWDDENLAHVARHDVQPAEVEELCFGSRKVVLRAKEDRYAVLGQTEAGRNLKAILASPVQGHSRVITARGMTAKERRYYHRLRKGRTESAQDEG